MRLRYEGRVRRLGAVLVLAACGAPPGPPRAGAPARVVSLLPSFTEIVVALGAGDRLVACTQACRPGRDLPRVSWQGAEAVEAIVRVRPDLVLRQGVRAGDDPLRRALEAVGVRLLVVPSETVRDLRRAIGRVGQALDLDAEAGRLRARFDRELAEARAAFSGRDPPRVLLVFGRDAGAAANITAAGPGTFLDEVLTLAGGRNVLADLRTPYPSIDLEEVVRRRPDVIVDVVPPEGTQAGARRAWEGLRAAVPAVRRGRVHAVLDNRILIPGPSLPAAVRRLGEMIHG
ncbi:MAG: ABC transporter substrate-binding protein [Planctomycetota bacterium]